MTEEIREKTPAEVSNWERVVDLIQTAFGEGRLAEEAIPRGESNTVALASWS